MTPVETKTLTARINTEFQPLNSHIQDHLPVPQISQILVTHGLDPKNLQNKVHGKEGHENVAVGNEVYVAISWFQFDTGRYEIVIRAHSEHDQLKEPYNVQMTPAEKRQAKRGIEKGLEPVNRIYHRTLADAMHEISQVLERNRLDAQEFEHQHASGNEGRLNAPVGNGFHITMTWHRMDVSGKYEIVCYMN
jgi:hypothetical protein